ncbi:glutamate racemase [Pseudoalteromonas sp. MSK9-3]|uniref:glutamate racemase n=1 Tax=Pseudoalteromonas sp. MSK9-3 TaxID=1897633 RepID=UPI000E6BFCB0|nr:glutamate racemase [Pseudoalteromonas sp. MSK9-3]RJE78393.1 glutamate racemase [Pseudoalteromonas sp. MSK9-3]
MSPHILVFDSGIGGTSVLEHIKASIPSAHFSYVMDNALLPYGLQSEQTIRSRLASLVQYIEAQELKVDIIVIACNTASTSALAATRHLTTIPIVGVVPAIKPAVRFSCTNHIALLATPATSNNAYTHGLIEQFAQGSRVDRHHSTSLVKFAEALYWNRPINEEEVATELRRIGIATKVDTIVLGCTHFPILTPYLKSFYGSGVTFVDSGEAIARRVRSLLVQVNKCPAMLDANDLLIEKPLQFYATAPDKISPNEHSIKLISLNSFSD